MSTRTVGSGLRRAAILLVALDPETGAKVFQSLGEDEVERISQEISRLGAVDREEMVEVLTEFKDVATVQRMLREGGYESAIDLIRTSLPEEKAERFVRLLEGQRRSMPFHILARAEAVDLVPFLREEHPQTVALVLSHLPPAKAAEVLDRFPEEQKVEIVRRIATLGPTSAEAIERVESGLEEHLASLGPGRSGHVV